MRIDANSKFKLKPENLKISKTGRIFTSFKKTEQWVEKQYLKTPNPLKIWGEV
jgi:hypothetical protein